MVAISLATVLGGVVMSLFHAQSKALLAIDERLAQFETLQEIKTLLREPMSCSATLKALNATGVPEGQLTTLKIVRGSQVVPVFTIEPEMSRRTGILSYRFQGQALTEADSGDLPGHYAYSNNGYVDFWVKFSRKSGAPQSKRIRIRAVTMAADDPRISFCYALGG